MHRKSLARTRGDGSPWRPCASTAWSHDVDKKRAELIEEIERQLQAKTSIEPVFTLRWTLADGATA